MLPYDTPSPKDLEKLMQGDFVSPPRTKNPKIPKALNDIIMKAMAPDIHARYQRASELLEEVLAARSTTVLPRRTSAALPSSGVEEMQSRMKARETPQAPKFCWHCRKPLHARADRCPFCGESQ
jgi:serine/threonine protein kinase